MLTSKKIAMGIELCAKEIFHMRKEELPQHFHDWNIESNYIHTIIKLLNTHYRNELPAKAVTFVHKYADLFGKSIREIGLEEAEIIRKEFEELIGLL